MKLATIVLLFFAAAVAYGAPSHEGSIPFDASELTLSTATPPAPLFTITDFSPHEGPIGTVVTIAGTGFTTVIDVRFGGLSAGFNIDNDLQITAVVPSGATSGQIGMTDNGGGVGFSSQTFTVAPHLTSFNPSGGPPGTLVNIFGDNVSSATSVTFNGTAASFIVISPLQLRATVPGGATTGRITVTNAGGSDSTAADFFVAPIVTSFTPAADTVGNTIAIHGLNFTGATAVHFNGTAAVFTVDSATLISAAVPRLAQSGPISVTAPGGTGTSADSFFVVRGGLIGATVFEDDDSDAVYDGADTAFPNVTVRLREAGADTLFGSLDDVVYPPAVTGPAGTFLFTDLPKGKYLLDVDETTLPAASILTTGNDPMTLYLTPAHVDTGAEIGYHLLPSSFCVTAYYDKNHNHLPDPGEAPLPGVDFTMTGTTQSFLETTDSAGNACFANLPADTYTLGEAVPDGYTNSNPASGSMTVTIYPGIDSAVTWLNAAALTDTLFRTGSMADWALAVDQKAKYQAVKCKPDKVDFKFTVRAPKQAASLRMKFTMLSTGVLYSDAAETLQVFTWSNSKDVTWTAPIDSGHAYVASGRGVKGMRIKVSTVWGTLPRTTNGKVLDGDYAYQYLRLPMPNLHNVGTAFEGLSLYPIFIGAEADSHSVVVMKYSDVRKSLLKLLHGIPRIHDTTKPARCLDVFDVNGKPILKQQKGLAPDKSDNKTFAELLALKLNLLASDNGIFPAGLGDLMYVNPGDPSDPFNGKSVDSVALLADAFLACAPAVNAMAEEYYLALHRINGSFSAPADTASWSCDNLVFSGARKLADAPYLQAEPGRAVPGTKPPRPRRSPSLPTAYALSQNYPNPFNPVTTIRIELPEEAFVTLKVYNLLGQEVATLLDHQAFDQGTEEIPFNAAALASGVYFYRLTAERAEEGLPPKTFTAVKKMMLLK